MTAARRAADELVAAGVGRVLLYGSVARGDCSETSDVDQVAIYDDLDYSERHSRRCGLEARASAAAGCPVDVMVTDAPEWAVRTGKVACSVEARAAGYAVELADAGDHPEIDWDKEIGLPDTDAGELAYRFTDMSNAVIRLQRNLLPDPLGIAAADEGDADEHRHREGVRFATATADVLAIVECAAKATHIVSLGEAPERVHGIAALLERQSESVRHAFVTLAGSDVDLDRLHLWRQGFTYVSDRPELPSEDKLRAHCAAALNIAAVAVDQCRHHGISPDELERWDRRVQRCNDVLDGPIRHNGGPGLSL